MITKLQITNCMMNTAYGYCSKQSMEAVVRHGGRLPVPCFARPSADGRLLQAYDTKASADGRALQAYGTKASADGRALQACNTKASADGRALQACGTKASADGRALQACNTKASADGWALQACSKAADDIFGKHPHRTVIANAVKQSMPHRWIASPFGLAITRNCGKSLPVFSSWHSA